MTLLGLSFKPGTDDIRDAPAIDIARDLVAAGASVNAHDPLVRSLGDIDLEWFAGAYEAAAESDAVVILTEWDEIAGMDLGRLANVMRGDLLIDGRNIFDADTAAHAGLRYRGIGRGDARTHAGSAPHIV